MGVGDCDDLAPDCRIRVDQVCDGISFHPKLNLEFMRSGAEPRKGRGAREVTETVFSTEVRSVAAPRGAVGLRRRRGVGRGWACRRAPAQRGAGGRRRPWWGRRLGDADWRGLRLDLAAAVAGAASAHDAPGAASSSASPSPPTYHRTAADFFKAVTSASDLDRDSLSPELGGRVARVIGTVPIAEYEGSPRRYGPRPADAPAHPVLPSAHSLLSSPSTYPPRPGFPQFLRIENVI
ncbi:Uncharacterized protein GBIM_09189 [Gryllus bimaculatus]|nr:Uncharacterized protein GBIM_09189 [Gryllus bimaculatus]